MLKGIGVSSGIGIGKVLHYVGQQEKELEQALRGAKLKNTSDLESQIYYEKQKIAAARQKFIEDTDNMIAALKKRLGDKDKTSLILKNQIYLVNDPEMSSRLEHMLQSDKITAEEAFERVCNEFRELFSSMNNEVMNQRVADIEDIKRRMLCIMLGIKQPDLLNLEENTVIVANELPPSATAMIDTSKVAAIIVENGGETSHVAILARALEIPAVLGAKGICRSVENGQLVIADGESGDIYVSPSEDIVKVYNDKHIEYIKKTEELKKYIDKETLTGDGIKVHLAANISDDSQALKAVDSGAEGVGLFRTEFLFMNGTSAPTEEEQFEAYRRAALICRQKPLTIRTVDIGGDKDIPYLGLEKESNPFLGFRGIRFCLGRKEIFAAQLRAILRASAYGNIRILLPMITCVDEIREVKRLLLDIKQQLDSKNIKYDKDIKLGIMIETPAAAVIADILANEADFFSIGTNDLVQYSMAVDRGNENVAYLYSIFNPALLRIIKYVTECAKKNGIFVGMCGEAASNRLMIPLLLAFGLDEFSVTASKLLETRKNISQWTMSEAVKIADSVLKMSTSYEIEEYLKNTAADKCRL